MTIHIFSDMDGTLLDACGRVSNTTIKTIRQSSLPVSLVSARSPREMMPAIIRLGLTTPQVAFNGGIVFQPIGVTWVPLTATPINLILARQIVPILACTFPDVGLSYYTAHNWFTEHIETTVMVQSQLTGLLPRVVSFVKMRGETPVYKIMLQTLNRHRLHQLTQFIFSQNWPITAKQSGRFCIELTSIETDKACGIDEVLAQDHGSLCQTAAFGDADNDVAMLTHVTVPIAMANATATLKQLAVHTTKTNQNDGVAFGIEQLRQGRW